ncbi:transcriptional regulator [Roseovarius sp. MMSF_3359]|uniref:transcriptional regulator n=2 Tax=unclassified Roseovarius TaxID=2614913 RepID=UPI00273E6A7E|nr:transcriptional regulator [Roseovarius sp. MMSF_3359]
MRELPKLDPMFHQQVRTRIAMLLYVGEPSFSQLKSSLAITDGNLDAHLRKLSSAGYLHSRMVLDARPHTVYQLSESGLHAFETYLDALRDILNLADEMPLKS